MVSRLTNNSPGAYGTLSAFGNIGLLAGPLIAASTYAPTILPPAHRYHSLVAIHLPKANGAIVPCGILAGSLLLVAATVWMLVENVRENTTSMQQRVHTDTIRRLSYVIKVPGSTGATKTSKNAYLLVLRHRNLQKVFLSFAILWFLTMTWSCK